MIIRIRLKEFRKQHQLSQEKLAETLGISRQSVISLERGEFLPSLPLLIDLVNFFETPLEQFINCEGYSSQKGGEKDMARDLTPWSPFREASSLHDAIDRMFEDTFAAPRMGIVPALNMPPVNMRETDKNIIIEVELPGVDEKDLDVEIAEDSLTVRGQKRTDEEIKEKDYYRREFSYGSFSRTIPLPAPVADNQAEAELKKGTLTITLPKVEAEKPKMKKITIKKK